MDDKWAFPSEIFLVSALFTYRYGNNFVRVLVRPRCHGYLSKVAASIHRGRVLSNWHEHSNLIGSHTEVPAWSFRHDWRVHFAISMWIDCKSTRIVLKTVLPYENSINSRRWPWGPLWRVVCLCRLWNGLISAFRRYSVSRSTISHQCSSSPRNPHFTLVHVHSSSLRSEAW